MAYIDFAELKEMLKIEDVAEWLQLEMKVSQHQLRAACPACGKGGDRALAITPGKQSYYCFAEQSGGDLIKLTAHIHGVGQREAAEALRSHFFRKAAPQSPQPRQEARGKAFDAEAYGASLDASHEAVEAVGFTKEVAEALGLGFCSKGVLTGYVAVPLRLPDGTISAYIGIQEARLPKSFNLTGKVVPLRRSA